MAELAGTEPGLARVAGEGQVPGQGVPGEEVGPRLAGVGGSERLCWGRGLSREKWPRVWQVDKKELVALWAEGWRGEGGGCGRVTQTQLHTEPVLGVGTDQALCVSSRLISSEDTEAQ